MKRTPMLLFAILLATFVAAQAAMHVLDIRHGLSESRIRKICQMPDGRIAIATTSTIDVFDGTRFSSYPLNPTYAYPLKSYKDKRQLTCDSAGRIWLRNKGSLFVVDTHNRILVEDVKKLINDLGLKDADIAAWPQEHSPHSYDSFNDISSILHDRYGGLWLGTLERGILYCNDQRDRQFVTSDTAFRHKSQPAIYSSRIKSLVAKTALSVTNCTWESNDGYAWVGTLNGLMVFDKKNRHLATISEHYGLSSDNVLSIISDKDNNIWIATANGISRVITLGNNRFEITNYGELDGISLDGREFRPLQIACDSIGRIDVGFGGGTVSFFPDSVNAPRYSFYYPNPYIQSQTEPETHGWQKHYILPIILTLLLIALLICTMSVILRRSRSSVVKEETFKDSYSADELYGVSDDTIQRLKSESEKTSADEVFLAKIKTIVEAHIDDDGFSVQSLSDYMAMDRTGLYRRLQSLTGKSPSIYIKEIRLDVAARLLRESDMSVSDIAEKTGYSSTKYFNKVFKQAFSLSPEEYRKNTHPVD